jgi:hypothetical protein
VARTTKTIITTTITASIIRPEDIVVGGDCVGSVEEVGEELGCIVVGGAVGVGVAEVITVSD